MKLTSYIKHHTSNVVRHPLFSGSAVMFVGTMGANAINYLYHLVLGRMLGPVDYGVLASLYSIIYLIGIIPTSASVSIVKFISSAKDNEVFSVYSTINKLIFKLTVIVSILLLLFSKIIAHFLHIENVLSVIFLSPILFFSLMALVNQATAQGLIKFVGNVVPSIISSAVKFVLGIFFIYLGWSVGGAMLAVVIGLSLAYLYSHKFIRKHIKKTKIKEIDLKSFIKYSGPVLLQSLAFTSIFTVDVLLVKHFLDPFSAGIYAALSTLGKIIFFATSPVIATMFPVVAKRRSSNQGYIKIFLASFLITSSISLVMTFFYWLFPELAIGILYGKEYLSASASLVWIGVFMLFYTLSNLLVNFFLSIGKAKVVILPLLAALVQAVLIWFVHENISQVIQISVLTTFSMFVCLSAYTGYNLYYEARKKE